MPSLNFTVFIKKIKSGTKTQTIRRVRKNPLHVGDRLFLFTGLRTKKCIKLGETWVSKISKIVITENENIIVDEKILAHQQCVELAKKDGFDTLRDFIQFFATRYTLPFTGVIIHWDPLKPDSSNG